MGGFRHAMTSLTTIRELVDRTQTDYEKCWAFLSSWKEGQLKPSLDQILDFQPRLGDAIFRLGQMHEALAGERTSLISRKQHLSSKWFNRRMKVLSAYQNALTEAIKIGRVIGDSFAWIFYQGERNRLRKHFLREPIFKIPSGLGGKGEIAFIKRFGVLNGHLLIYHGITSFLRIGDVSFWNPASNSITAIGELKAGAPTESGFGMRLYLIWPDSSEAMWPRPTKRARPFDTPQPTTKREKQLEKQLKTMAASLNLPQFRQVIEVHHQTHLEEFRRMVDRLKKKSSVVEKAGDGLLLVGLTSSRERSLFGRLLPKRMMDLNRQLAGIEKHAFSIIDVSQAKTPNNTNSFFIGTLDLGAFPGTAPMFWWPVPSEFVRKMIFHEVTVTAIYNPAHLIRKLRELEYEVRLKRTTMIVSKMVDGTCIVFGNMHHFLVYVQRHLLREESVIKIFQGILDGIEAERLLPNTRIDLDTQLFY
jgi:hypothetical protein